MTRTSAWEATIHPSIFRGRALFKQQSASFGDLSANSCPADICCSVFMTAVETEIINKSKLTPVTYSPVGYKKRGN